MKRTVGFVAAALCFVAADLISAQSAQAGVEKLYILNCGEGVAGDISRWSPGVNEGKSMDFVDNCYLIKHSQGWFLWDTGITDAVADMPNGLAPADPKAVTWHRPKKLAVQLEQLGVKPSDIKAMAISHTHPDHIGNVEMFPDAMLYVQKAEYDWPGANNAPRFKPEHPVTKLEGDRDIFGDGSLVVLSTPGHTPGHQSLLVKLPKTGEEFKPIADAGAEPTIKNLPGLLERVAVKIETGTRFATVLTAISAPSLRSAMVRLSDSALWCGHAIAGAPWRT